LVIINFAPNDFNSKALAKKIQEDPRFQKIALIFLLPLSEELQRESWRFPGKICCVTKPICTSVLLDAVVRSLFKLSDLPLSIPIDETPLNPATSPLNSAPQSIRILVAEDNQINRIVITEILKNAGMEYAVVENGEQAVESIKTGSFNVVLMDCQMPLMDGYEATQKIRQWEKETSRFSRIPIIALTANVTSEDETKCLDAGMDAYCSKPVNASKLLGLIRQSQEKTQVT
jgi:CheY-like chemotaxis protein